MALHNISTACIIEYQGTILMIEEVQNGKINWDLPAGGLEVGETIIEGVSREVKEEVNLSLNGFKLVKVFQFKNGETTRFNFLFHTKIESDQLDLIKPNSEEGIKATKFYSTKDIEEQNNSYVLEFKEI